jgi:hypothetical protein
MAPDEQGAKARRGDVAPPLAPVPVRPPGGSGRLRTILVIAAALAVVGIGLGLIGDGRNRPAPTETTAAVESIGPSPTPVARPTHTPAPTRPPGPTPTPGPTPVVTPAVPCNSDLLSILFPVQLLVGDTLVVDGAANGAPQPEVTVPVGARSLLILGAEHCALAWTITSTMDDSDEVLPLATIDNPSGDASFAAQNRWDLTDLLPQGDQVLDASFTLGDGIALSAEWHVHNVGFPIPGAALSAPSGAYAVATLGCRLEETVGSKTVPVHRCDGDLPPGTDLRAVAFSTGDIVTFHLAQGWSLQPQSVACGGVTSAGGTQLTYTIDPGCVIKLTRRRGPGELFDFTVSAGQHVVRVDLEASQADRPANTLMASYYVAVNVLP